MSDEYGIQVGVTPPTRTRARKWVAQAEAAAAAAASAGKGVKCSMPFKGDKRPAGLCTAMNELGLATQFFGDGFLYFYIPEKPRKKPGRRT